LLHLYLLTRSLHIGKRKQIAEKAGISLGISFSPFTTGTGKNKVGAAI